MNATTTEFETLTDSFDNDQFDLDQPRFEKIIREKTIMPVRCCDAAKNARRRKAAPWRKSHAPSHSRNGIHRRRTKGRLRMS